MRRWRGRKKWVALAGVVGVGAVAAVLASGGFAAGKAICTTPSIPSCLTELVAPHFIAAGNDAVSVTKFTNESGSGGATATHVVLTATFPTAVTVKSVATDPATSDCTGTSGLQTTVSCSYGSIAGGGTARLTVRFSTSTSMTVTGSVSYGEGGGTSGNPQNSVQADTDTLTVAGDSSASGGCFDGTPPTVNASTTAQGTTAIVSSAAGSLPCTFVDAGVNLTKRPGGKTFVSFVEFPVMPTPATVKLFFTPLPSGLKNNFPLNEDTGNGIVVVPDCNGATTPPAGFDSCIFNRSPLARGGLEIDMYVTGSPFDGSYWG